MPIGICGKCGKPCPDSVHDFKEICLCKTKDEWISYAKEMDYMIRIDGKKYSFNKPREK